MREQSRKEALDNFGRIFGRLVLFIVFIIILLNVLGDDDGKPQLDHAIKTENTTEVVADEIKEYQNLNYEDVARDKDGLAGKHIKFEGEVIQVMPSGSKIITRIANLSNTDEMYYVKIEEDKLDYNLLEKDYVYIEGTLYGIEDYRTALGSRVSIPGIKADIIELRN